MDIGQKLKQARLQANLTQEQVADRIFVSRQTVSNWENEKTLPDIASVIKLSDLYSISLDELLKGDQKMIDHLEESTNVVESNKRLLWAITLNVVLFCLFLIIAGFNSDSTYLPACVLSVMVVSMSFLLYQIIRKM